MKNILMVIGIIIGIPLASASLILVFVVFRQSITEIRDEIRKSKIEKLKPRIDVTISDACIGGWIIRIYEINKDATKTMIDSYHMDQYEVENRFHPQNGRWLYKDEAAEIIKAEWIEKHRKLMDEIADDGGTKILK